MTMTAGHISWPRNIAYRHLPPGSAGARETPSTAAPSFGQGDRSNPVVSLYRAARICELPSADSFLHESLHQGWQESHVRLHLGALFACVFQGLACPGHESREGLGSTLAWPQPLLFNVLNMSGRL